MVISIAISFLWYVSFTNLTTLSNSTFLEVNTLMCPTCSLIRTASQLEYLTSFFDFEGFVAEVVVGVSDDKNNGLFCHPQL